MPKYSFYLDARGVCESESIGKCEFETIELASDEKDILYENLWELYATPTKKPHIIGPPGVIREVTDV